MNQIKNTNKIAFIKASWHADIIQHCNTAFIKELSRRGWSTNQIEIFEVPGALEIPLLAKKLAFTGNYSCIVTSAFVVDGGIYQHEFVASTVVSALMDIQLQTNVPIISAVLTPHNYQETKVHNDFFAKHFEIKGLEAASACDEVLTLYGKLADFELSQEDIAAA
jgi:6,7-dimethyl-8-ribityllumazine synthase